EDVLVDAEDLRVDARHRDLTLVGRRQRVGDPEAAEVAGLPENRQPQVPYLARASQPDQVEVCQAGEEHEAEQPHEVHARMPDPRRVEGVARAVIAQDGTEELKRRDGEQHLHDTGHASPGRRTAPPPRGQRLLPDSARPQVSTVHTAWPPGAMLWAWRPARSSGRRSRWRAARSRSRTPA